MSFLTDIFLPSGAQTSAEQQANYERLRQLEAERLARRQAEGTLTTPQEQFYLSNTEPELMSQDQAAWEGAKEGAAEGLNNVLDAPGKAVGAISGASGQLVWGVLKNVPWWAWLAAAAALFVWMGGLTLLRGRLAK